MKFGSRLRRAARLAVISVGVFLVLGVWVTHQFPSLFSAPKTSVELLEDLFRAPGRIATEPAKFLLEHASCEAAARFVSSLELPENVRKRLSAELRGERMRTETVPFVLYLYYLYGTELTAEESELDGLGYAEPEGESGGATRAALPALLERSSALRRHVATALALYDVLFLREPLEATASSERLTARLEGAALDDLRTLLRRVADEMFSRADAAAGGEADENDYLVELERVLADDERLTDFAESFSDLVRELSNGWLHSFVRAESRKERRLEWVSDRLAANRYHEVADWARARANRRMVVHVTVDGLQGKLLEGLTQLSMGDRSGAGARYVAELVKEHSPPELNPAAREAGLPPPLGDDVRTLVRDAPVRPDFLENFKRFVYSPNAQAVRVHVATVDTPTISVRNLPIIFSGHRVAGAFGTGIPNFSYVDRQNGRGWYFWGSDALHMRRIFGNREDEIPAGRKRPDGPGARTLFERLWRYSTISCMATIDTGALERVSPEVGVMVGEARRNFAEKALVLHMRRRAEMERELNEKRRWLADHRHLSDSFLASLVFNAIELRDFRQHAEFLALHDDEALPDYLLWYNPWPDHFAHAAGPYSDEIIGFEGEYDRLDFYFGKLIDALSSVTNPFTGETYLEQTLVGLASDHGLVYTPRLVGVEKSLFGPFSDEGVGISYLKLSADEGSLPVIRGRDSFPRVGDHDVVVGSTAGGSYVLDVFSAQRSQAEDWKHHPDFHDLQAMTSRSGVTIDWIRLVRQRLDGVMDFAVARERGPKPGATWPEPVESVVRVFTSNRGDARIWRYRGDSRETPLYRYEVLGDRDPLDLAGSIREYLVTEGGRSVGEIRGELQRAIASGVGLSAESWTSLLSHTLRADSIYQLSQLYDSDRAGTINVFPASGIGMNSGVAGRHAGESFGEKNGTVFFFGAGLDAAVVQTARAGSVPVTLYHWLVGDEVFRAPDPDPRSGGVPPAEQFGYRSLLDDSAFEGVNGRE